MLIIPAVRTWKQEDLQLEITTEQNLSVSINSVLGSLLAFKSSLFSKC